MTLIFSRRLARLIIGATLVISFVMLVTAQSSVAQMLKPPSLKIGVVNSELLYQSYPEFRRMESQLQKEAEGWQAEREGWIAQMQKSETVINDKESQLKAGANTFTEKRKAQLQTEIDSLKSSLQERYSQQMAMEQDRFAKRKAELLSGVLETVNQQIEALGAAEGFDFILDSSNGTIVYARDPEDLTDKLLRKLKEK